MAKSRISNRNEDYRINPLKRIKQKNRNEIIIPNSISRTPAETYIKLKLHRDLMEAKPELLNEEPPTFWMELKRNYQNGWREEYRIYAGINNNRYLDSSRDYH